MVSASVRISRYPSAVTVVVYAGGVKVRLTALNVVPSWKAASPAYSSRIRVGVRTSKRVLPSTIGVTAACAGCVRTIKDVVVTTRLAAAAASRWREARMCIRLHFHASISRLAGLLVQQVDEQSFDPARDPRPAPPALLDQHGDRMPGQQGPQRVGGPVDGEPGPQDS